MKTKQVFNNARWLIVCKIAQSILQLIIGMISARYLGPSQYGLINYAASIIAFALPVMRLGFSSTLVWELMDKPEKEGEILGTSMLMNVASSVVCMGAVFAFVSFANAGETVTIIVCLLYSTSVFFAALEMIQYWFQYKLLAKYSSLIMLGGYVLVSAYKIFLLVTGKNVYWFALSHSVEYAIIGIALIIVYSKKGGAKLTVSWPLVGGMLSRSKHYIFAALMVITFQNTDHIMLTNMLGTEANGFYTAAVTCTGVSQFVFTAIIDSMRLQILEAKKLQSADYGRLTARLYGIIFYLSIAQSIVFTIFARIIIQVLYGADFMPAVPVLQILTWYCAFSYVGTVRNVWILAEQKQKFLPLINLIGALFNVVLNMLMIPWWGPSGAAFASFLTQIFTNVGLSYIIKPMRENNRLLWIGLNPRFFVREMKQLVRELRKTDGGESDEKN